MAKTTIKVEGMMCEGCVKTVKESLEKVPGVTSVDVNLKKGTATVQQDGVADDVLVKAVVDAGFRGSVKHGLFG
ncbi:MAG: heavy metal-associated domain-containing protein [Thermoplasmata archaeon]|nr:heavy metal-associated domain-containing protein [Thermoplasmata archaeon]